MKQSKNKDGIITVLFIFCAIFILIGLGATFAYFTSTTDFENEFNTASYQTTATEVFESPSNWLPGDETPKTLTVTNTGNVNVKARVCISEEWISSKDDTLPNEVNGQSMAIINLDNTSDWTKKGNCYEYNEVLEPNHTTSSFIESVTFNPNATAALNCTPTTTNIYTCSKSYDSCSTGTVNGNYCYSYTSCAGGECPNCPSGYAYNSTSGNCYKVLSTLNACSQGWTDDNGVCKKYNQENCTGSTILESHQGPTTKTCTSRGDGYDNATYKLTLTVETIQANKASEVWPPIIQYVNRQTENQITVGDEISIAGEHFYVVSSDQNDTVLLAKYNLLVGDVYEQVEGTWTKIKSLSESDEGYGLQNETAKGFVGGSTHIIGIVAFSGTNYWDNSVCQYNGVSLGCTGTSGLLSEYATNVASYSGSPYPDVYRSNIGNTIAPNYAYGSPWGYAQNNGYTIAYYVEGYKDKLIELGAPSTIVGRLLTYEEGQTIINGSTNPLKSHLYDSTYWLGSAGLSYYIWRVYSDGYFDNIYFYYDVSSGVHPVIEIPTSELE